jgi:histidine ammonia-lyase
MFELSEYISIADIKRIIDEDLKICLSDARIQRINKCHEYLHEKIDRSEFPIYGVSTGFGSLCDTSIEANQLIELQKNLLRSHACGIGDEVPQPLVRLMLLLKVASLSLGHSGVQMATIERLLDMYNRNITPQVFEQGSLGASGDLAPLAHLALPLIGEGMLYAEGKLVEAASIYPEAIDLRAKEGLALINGTQFMLAYAIHTNIEAQKLCTWVDCIGSMSLEAFDCRSEPFWPQSHAIRPHLGQILSASRILQLLENSELQKQEKKYVQDPYSFRCMPQVHGASIDAIETCRNVFEIELNSVTDNPNVFPEADLILSAGNFHGQPLAIHLDFQAIAIAELASISERRTYKLISGERGLKAFLTKNPGLNSGLMISQYTAASIVSQNKQLCHPASVDSIVSSNGQEDHVSMGANAATKCLRVLDNSRRVVGIELLHAAQALDFRGAQKTSSSLYSIHTAFRKKVAFIEEDLILSPLIHQAEDFIRDFQPL